MTHEEIVAWLKAAHRGDRDRVRDAWKAATRRYRETHPAAGYPEYTHAGRTAAQVEIVLIEWRRNKKDD